MAQGRIAAIALKPEHRGAMHEVDSAELGQRGFDGQVPTSGHRRVTLISAEQWAETMAELGASLPWHARRANVLVEGLRGPEMLGKTLQVGDIELQVNGETDPCERMDEIHGGLRQALEPDCRGGVYASVVRPGTLRVGDTIRVVG
jgi:MOSC domain-containing protein YiiM